MLQKFTKKQFVEYIGGDDTSHKLMVLYKAEMLVSTFRGTDGVVLLKPMTQPVGTSWRESELHLRMFPFGPGYDLAMKNLHHCEGKLYEEEANGCKMVFYPFAWIPKYELVEDRATKMSGTEMMPVEEA